MKTAKSAGTASALIYHTGALGDFITTIPALRLWKNQNRGVKLFLLGKSAVGELAKDIGLIDEVLDVNSARTAPLFFDDFTSHADDFFASFKTAILFATPGSPILKNVRQSNIPSRYSQPPFPAAEDKIHISDYHLSLFTDPNQLVPAEKIPTITPSETSLKKSLSIVPKHLSPMAIHPGSGSKKKNWPLERFLALAGTLRKKGFPVVWLLGPAEDSVNIPSHNLVAANQTLSLCAALLSRCRAFIGNDSGMAHLAAGVGCRTVALFGPSDPAVWAPCGKDVRVIYKKRPCAPCHHSATAPPSCDNGCMTAITVEDVLERI
jgi:heptosyltransferase-3